MSENKKLRIYIAGPMQGYPKFNFPAFDSAADSLQREGHKVFNPADKDRENYGKTFGEDNETGSIEAATEFSLRDALALDTHWICKEADAIYMLKGWERSNGARAEHALATALNLEIKYQ